MVHCLPTPHPIHLLTIPTGKNWHTSKAAFRPKSGQSSYADRLESRKALAITKARVKEMKEEKEAARQVRYYSSERGAAKGEGVNMISRGLEQDHEDQRSKSREGGEGEV